MRRLDLAMTIAAPAELVFDTSLRVDVHIASMAGSGERAVGGVTSGQLRLGDEVTWLARHFGISWRMTSRIVAYERPGYFVDEQVSGPFALWRHAHHITEQAADLTELRDVIDFAAPYGPVGRLAETLILDRYLTRLIVLRNRYLATVCTGLRP